MTEAEVLYLIAEFTSNSIATFTLYLSLTFGYLSVAYFVGKKLSSMQTIILSLLYFVSSSIAMLSAHASTQIWHLISEAYPPPIKGLLFISGSNWIIVMDLMLSAGIILSLFFMLDCRKAKK